MSAQLLSLRGDRTELLASEPMRSTSATPATFRGVPPGEYFLDLHEVTQRRRFRLRLVVRPTQ